MNLPITTKAANSTFLVRFSAAIYGIQDNTTQHDKDICAAIGYKIGTASTTATDHTAITTYDPTRERITFANSEHRAFYSHDAYAHDARAPAHTLMLMLIVIKLISCSCSSFSYSCFWARARVHVHQPYRVPYSIGL